MKKEYILVITIALFLLAYAIDFLAGPVSFTVKNPVMFLSDTYFSKYPFTALAIGFRTLGIVSAITLILSVIERKYFLKAGISLFLTVLAELYAIQQMATGGRTTTIQWTLSFSYAGALLALATIIYILKGIFTGIKDTISPKAKEYPDALNITENNNTSSDNSKGKTE